MKTDQMKMNAWHLLLPLCALLASCQTAHRPLPGPIQYPRSEGVTGQSIGGLDTPRQRLAVNEVPPAPQRVAAASQGSGGAPAPAFLDDGEPVSIAIEQTPLPMFVQILFGNVLKRTYTLDPAVSTRTDPVTFKTSQPLSKTRVMQLADTLLRNYGLVVQDLDGLVRIAPQGAVASTAVPLLQRSSSGMADGGHAGQRPVFHYVELSVVRVSDMSQWLKQMLGSRVNLQEDAAQNAFLISGPSGDVKAAIELIQSLDQPRMRGRVARRLTPAHASAQDLAVRLSEVLGAQGYAVGMTVSGNATTVLILPIPTIGSLVVFTGSEATMDHVLRWAKELDQPPQNARSNNALFTYPVRYADAQSLAQTLSELLGGSAAPAAQSGGSSPMGGAAPAPARSSSGGRVVVNNATNTLIFRGSTVEEQQQIRQLLQELDRPTKSAMIEVVVAELAVGALQRLGVQWSYNGLAGVANTRTATMGGSGFTLSYTNSARDILAAIDALASDSQARVLSNPKVMARNGEIATIQVGSEVPIVTTQQSTVVGAGPFPGTGTNGILQQIQYRATGVILRVRPVINSGNRLDLEVQQEVSSAASTETGVTSSPTISTRRIDTKLSLRDGSTVLLGGLISRDTSTSKGGVPLLKDIPLLGAAFRNKSEQVSERELLVMITPYVVNDDFEAEEVSAAIHRTFGSWAQDIKTSRVVTSPEPRLLPVLPAQPEVADAPGEQPAPPPKEVQPEIKESPRSESSPANDIELSTPEPVAPVAPPASAPPSSDAKAKPAASEAKPSPAREGGKAAEPPRGVAGRPVTDKKLLEEFQRDLKKSR